jgi:hypothetical protein
MFGESGLHVRKGNAYIVAGKCKRKRDRSKWEWNVETYLQGTGS